MPCSKKLMLRVSVIADSYSGFISVISRYDARAIDEPYEEISGVFHSCWYLVRSSCLPRRGHFDELHCSGRSGSDKAS